MDSGDDSRRPPLPPSPPPSPPPSSSPPPSPPPPPSPLSAKLPATKNTYLRPKKEIRPGDEKLFPPPSQRTLPPKKSFEKFRIPEWPQVTEDFPFSTVDDFDLSRRPSVSDSGEGPSVGRSTSFDSGKNLSDYMPDEVRSVFISGLPSDMIKREIANLVRWFPGAFPPQQGRSQEGSLILKVQFSTEALATDAKNKLHNLLYDPDENIVLQAELASNDAPLERVFIGSRESRSYQGVRIGGSTSSIPQPPQFGTRTTSGSSTGFENLDLKYLANALSTLPDFTYLTPPLVNPAAHVQTPSAAQLQDYHRLGILAENKRKAKESHKNLDNKVGYKDENKDDIRTCSRIVYKQIKNLQEEVTVSIVEFEDQDDDALVNQNQQRADLHTSQRYGLMIQYPYL